MPTFAVRCLERVIRHRSTIGDSAFFTPDVFPWAVTLENNWQAIRGELDQLLARRDDLPNFQDISEEQRDLTADANWKTYFFAAYGVRFARNTDRCPCTTELLNGIDGLETAFFSILGPGKHLPEHRGPYNGVIRYHLGLKIPSPATDCGITVRGETAHWEEGKSLVFDDSYPHEAWNRTGEDRVVLFLDIRRPLPFPYSALNQRVIRRIGKSPFIQKAEAKHAAWEKGFDAAPGPEKPCPPTTR
ncbi:aspartyl/asparaginyl beta-hydroxylase domain-containing protein [Streptomyces sp. NPDC056773]|uniref:aspartyl/asparaginyl beta-hydroxylase domain-containing protein n=1 Tax=unclassified Streptomyces TaxID=2593676 RepID=UPI0036783023